MLSNIQWCRQGREEGIRPLRGFTTGTATVKGSTLRIEARFNDQNLSNRLSDLEGDGEPITLQVTVLGSNEVYRLPVGVPTLERAGACYILRGQGKAADVSAVHAA